MKFNISIIKKAFVTVMVLMAVGCQDMDRPDFSNYPKDVNPVGSTLKFFVPFEDNTSDPLRFAVDNIRAKFPNDNPLSQTDGIAGKAIKGDVPKKFIAYSNANDFAATAASLTVAFWSKHDAPTQTEFAFALTSRNGLKAAMFLMVEGTAAMPIVKFHIDEEPTSGGSNKWFEWTNLNAIPGIFDNEWHHFAIVYDASTSTMVFYKDGIAYQPNSQWTDHGPIIFNTSKINGFRIGGSGDPAQGWMNSWTGALDQFRLYSSALTEAEVNELFTGKK